MMFIPVKKSLLVAAITTVSLFASAEVLVHETFDYPNGGFNGRNGGTGFTSSWVNYQLNADARQQIIDQRAVMSTQPGWSSATRRFNAIDYSDGGAFYFSYNIEVLEYTAITSTSYLDALVFMSGGSGVFQTGFNYNSSGYAMNSQVLGSGNPSGHYGTRYATAGTELFVVGKFSYDKDSKMATISYWIDPEEAGAQPLYSASWLIENPTVIDGLRLQRFDNDNHASSSTSFGNIIIGTDWDSVVPAIPEPAHAVALLGVAMMVVGVSRYCRRR